MQLKNAKPFTSAAAWNGVLPAISGKECQVFYFDSCFVSASSVLVRTLRARILVQLAQANCM
jgi:hypothetical protein